MTSPLFRWGLGSALAAGVVLLGACSSNDDRGAFTPTPTPTAIPVTPTATPTPEPTPTPAFVGSSADFVQFLRDQPLDGDPFPVNDGSVMFTDTAADTDPVVINN
jgi:hypothetical protein